MKTAEKATTEGGEKEVRGRNYTHRKRSQGCFMTNIRFLRQHATFLTTRSNDVCRWHFSLGSKSILQQRILSASRQTVDSWLPINGELFHKPFKPRPDRKLRSQLPHNLVVSFRDNQLPPVPTPQSRPRQQFPNITFNMSGVGRKQAA